MLPSFYKSLQLRGGGWVTLFGALTKISGLGDFEKSCNMKKGFAPVGIQYAPQWHNDYFKLRTSEQTAATEKKPPFADVSRTSWKIQLPHIPSLGGLQPERRLPLALG